MNILCVKFLDFRWHNFCIRAGMRLQMAMNSMISEAEDRRHHAESGRLAQEARRKQWSSFRDGLTDGRRFALKTVFWFGVLIATFNYRNQIAEFLIPAAQTVLVRVQHLGDNSKLKQAINQPDTDIADIAN